MLPRAIHQFCLTPLPGCIYDHAKSLRRAFNDGHLVGSHGWEHQDFTQLSRKQMHSELARNERAFQKILGVKVRRPELGPSPCADSLCHSRATSARRTAT